MNLHHPQLDASILPLARFVQNMVEPKKNGYLLVLYGANGCGKTHIAKKLATIFETNRMKIGPVHCEIGGENDEPTIKIADCIYRHWPTVIDRTKMNEWYVFEQLRAEYLVIIDDCGAEHDPSGIALEKLYVVLNRRERMRTVITTNFPPDAWEGKFERRIASRLFRNATHIDLSQVPDYSTI